jgi:hypothetical protein
MYFPNAVDFNQMDYFFFFRSRGTVKYPSFVFYDGIAQELKLEVGRELGAAHKGCHVNQSAGGFRRQFFGLVGFAFGNTFGESGRYGTRTSGTTGAGKEGQGNEEDEDWFIHF